MPFAPVDQVTVRLRGAAVESMIAEVNLWHRAAILAVSPPNPPSGERFAINTTGRGVCPAGKAAHDAKAAVGVATGGSFPEYPLSPPQATKASATIGVRAAINLMAYPTVAPGSP